MKPCCRVDRAGRLGLASLASASSRLGTWRPAGRVLRQAADAARSRHSAGGSSRCRCWRSRDATGSGQSSPRRWPNGHRRHSTCAWSSTLFEDHGAKGGVTTKLTACFHRAGLSCGSEPPFCGPRSACWRSHRCRRRAGSRRRRFVRARTEAARRASRRQSPVSSSRRAGGGVCRRSALNIIYVHYPVESRPSAGDMPTWEERLTLRPDLELVRRVGNQPLWRLAWDR